MPLINPGIVASSPFLADQFAITRVTQVVNDLGRMVHGGYENLCAFGIITQASAKDLERFPEFQQYEAVISITTRTPLRVVAPGAQPDVITWAGTSYLVKKVLPNPHFGQGWYKALAVSQNAVDIPPEV